MGGGGGRRTRINASLLARCKFANSAAIASKVVVTVASISAITDFVAVYYDVGAAAVACTICSCLGAVDGAVRSTVSQG